MTEEVFGGLYASAYDGLYGDKDYDRECDNLEDMLAAYGPADASCILDLGCGTGSHAVRLAQRGYQVTGVDRSPEMVRLAQAKAEGNGATVNLHCADIGSYRDGSEYDAVLMMFAVLGYQRTNEQVARALRTARTHLGDGGVFIADFWYGPGVLRERPVERVAIRDDGPGDLVIRVARPSLETAQHVCHVDYRIIAIRHGHLAGESRERHTMRFFFPMELEGLCDRAQLQLKSLLAFPDCDRAPTDGDWNALMVASAADAGETLRSTA